MSIRKLRRVARWPWRAVWAVANRNGWFARPPVGSSPHLDAEALRKWREAIENADIYLEYGSGGSTVEAAQSVAHVFSVETDRRYLAAVTQRLLATGAKAQFHPVDVNIGLTEMWGFPLMSLRTAGRLKRWSQYSAAPWAELEAEGLVPNFIFVDGRFRVASTLESLLRLPADANCLFMLDDFSAREEHYGSVIRPFITDVSWAGHALLFRQSPDLDREACARELEKAQADPD